MSKADYSTWLTKTQAADAIGVSTKTVEKFADDGKLQQAEWKRPGGGPRIAVYHPRDVERLRKARNPGAEPFVLPAAVDERPSADKAVAVRQPGAERFMQVLAATMANSANSQNLAGVRLAERPFLRIGEASEYTGLGVAFLRRWIAEGKLKLIKGAGQHGADVLRRADLDKL
jgi:excisionase family DNA binding protein